MPATPRRRRLKYPQYKAQRAAHPPQLVSELAAILAVVDALGLPVLAVPGVEADDVVGTLAARAAADGFHVVIVSPDRVRRRGEGRAAGRSSGGGARAPSCSP